MQSKGFAALFLAATFLLGGALGYSADRVLSNRTSQACNNPSMRGYWDVMTKEWDITPQQRVVIDSLLDIQRKRIDSVFEPLRPALDSARARSDALSDSTLTQIRAVMTPQQQAKMDAMRADVKQRAELRKACREGTAAAKRDH